MINIDKVSKSYGKDQVLDEVGLSIDKGKFTAFIGPNGAGKSTLLSLISRLLPKEKGYLYIKGQEIESWDSLNLAKELSMLKQKVDYQVKLTVEELISFGRYPYSQGRLSTEDYQKIDQAITYMKTLRSLVDDLGKTVVVVIHDVNVASQFVDVMVAFKDGKVFSHGSPDQVMTEDILGRLYDMKITIADIDGKKICLYR